METLPPPLEALQAIAGRHSQIPQLTRIMQIKQFSPACPAKIGRKCSCCLRSLVIEQVLRQSISEGFNHITILSELDNKAS